MNVNSELYIISNTNVRFKEPEEVVENLLNKLNNFPWDWDTIDRLYPNINGKKMSDSPHKTWWAEPWRLQCEELKLIGTWGDGTEGHVKFYFLYHGDNEICFWLTNVAADLNITIRNSNLNILDDIRKSPEDSAFFDDYRRLLMQICHALGGDRVIYFDRNAIALDGWDMMFNAQNSFDDIEAFLLKKIGPPVQTRFHVFEDKKTAKTIHNYYIDRFEDLIK
jgi:hypothetical protein